MVEESETIEAENVIEYTEKLKEAYVTICKCGIIYMVR